MKKTFTILLTLWGVSCIVAAQDTVHFWALPSNYYNNYWYSPPDNVEGQYNWLGDDGRNDVMAWGMYSKDTLTVYGIAGCIYNMWKYYGEYSDRALIETIDTTFDTLYDYMRLYKKLPGDSMLQIGEDLMVHLENTPVSYWLCPDIYFIHSHDTAPIPMYERYFSTPVTVCDTFFVGKTFLMRHPVWVEVNGQTYRRYNNFGTHLAELGLGYYPYTTYMPSAIHCDNTPLQLHPWDPNYYTWFFWDAYAENLPFLFPILTPPDTTVISSDTIITSDTVIVCDTIIVDNDTTIVCDTTITIDTILSIPNTGLTERLTGVMPNPAAETAKVVSSFGLSHIEAYNLAGQKVDELHLPTPSLSATLDVRRWPAGTYLLRIHTPQGVTTKKLTVVR